MALTGEVKGNMHISQLL